MSLFPVLWDYAVGERDFPGEEPDQGESATNEMTERVEVPVDVEQMKDVLQSAHRTKTSCDELETQLRGVINKINDMKKEFEHLDGGLNTFRNEYPVFANLESGSGGSPRHNPSSSS